MGENLPLKWQDFKNNSTGLLEYLRKDTNFTDVTLVAEGGQWLKMNPVFPKLAQNQTTLNHFLELADELCIKGLLRNFQIDQKEAISKIQSDRYGKEGITYKEGVTYKDQEGITNLNK